MGLPTHAHLSHFFFVGGWDETVALLLQGPDLSQTVPRFDHSSRLQPFSHTPYRPGTHCYS